MILRTRNIQLGVLNECVGASIPGRSRAYLSADATDNPEEYEFRQPVELLNSILGTESQTHHEPSLRKGCTVMFLRDLQPSKEPGNAARYVVKSVTDNVLLLLNATFIHEKARLTLSQIPGDSGDYKFPTARF